MDPNATVKEINASACREAIASLNRWRMRGGFAPSIQIDPLVLKDCDIRDVDVVRFLRGWIRESGPVAE